MPKLSIGIVTCSDTRTEAEDTAGRALIELSREAGWTADEYRLVRDDREQIGAAIVELADERGVDIIFTCGGTGFSTRDVTPEATIDVADRMAPGIAEHLRAASMQVTRRAMLSRAVSALRGTTLIINFPGSEKAARESFGFVADQLEHAIDMMAGGGH